MSLKEAPSRRGGDNIACSGEGPPGRGFGQGRLPSHVSCGEAPLPSIRCSKGDHKRRAPLFPTEELIRGLKDKDWSTRYDAAKMLGAKKDPAAVPALIAALNDEKAVKAAAEALNEIPHDPPPSSLPILVSCLRFAWDPEKGYVRSALVKLGEPAARRLLQALANENWVVRSNAIWVLGELGSREAVPAFASMLEGEPWTLRCNIVEALGKIDSPGTIPPLLAAMEDGKDTVRSFAGRVLLEKKDPRIIPGLVRLLEGNRDVWQNTEETLVGIGTPALPALIEAAADASQEETARLRAKGTIPHILGYNFYIWFSDEGYGRMVAALEGEGEAVKSRSISLLGQLFAKK